MALCSDFEGLRGTIIFCNPLPTVESVVHNLIAKETRIRSQANKGSKKIITPVVFVVPQQPNTSNQSQPKVAFHECTFCKNKNNWNSLCPLLAGKGPP